MISRTLFVVVFLSVIQASRQQESLGELRIVEPLPNQVITDKTYRKVEWILDERLGFNHHVVEGKSLCIQIESALPSNFAPFKKCYSLCNMLRFSGNVRSRCNVDDAEYEQSGNLRCDHS